jgi:peptidoglycan/xylan/chitin deacetylase (PgdA/CDA1 family)
VEGEIGLMSGPSSQPGALVVSLDFEQHWGMRDHVGRGETAYADLAETPAVVAELCDLFARRGIRATWATVGFLFATNGGELADFLPDVRPAYQRPEFDPYAEPVGADEGVDPEHLAGSLVQHIASIEGQEVASHTFSHFYCLESGQDEKAFRSDLAAAQAMALSCGLELSSLVLPRNQWNPDYAGAVIDAGFTCIRGPQPSRGHGARPHDRQGLSRRAARLLEAYGGVSPPPTIPWTLVRQENGLCDIPASAFLRPFDPKRLFLEPVRRARLISGLRAAARGHRIFHLWWHPHNFVRHRRENFDFLNSLLDEYDRLAHSEGMRSLTMRDAVSSL